MFYKNNTDMLNNLRDFNKISDYLPLLNAVLITDLLGILLSNMNLIHSNQLKKWYREYNLSAVIADVSIILIVLIIARYLYNYIFKDFSIIKFIILAVSIQIIHDILFYILITIIPKGANRMIDTFKDYAIEISYKAIIADSVMIITSCLLAYYLVNKNMNTNIILLISLLYLAPYLLYK